MMAIVVAVMTNLHVESLQNEASKKEKTVNPKSLNKVTINFN